ncbi:MAG TPA: leucyl/phenylalanyl-tRNA--protein transferase [Burkholderiaceae bacterium]|jgi:leucyl/phenylalanyl-tRNA--protein transferase|nr:leucyl/phenylalanyl-tRNA--protein transferase [Burkholderiaceae bacterium]
MIPWLPDGAPFPPASAALKRPNGLLAASALSQLTATRLAQAYRSGIFPWFSEGEPALWWSPDPRMVLFIDEFHLSRSLRKAVRAAAASAELEVSADRAFEAVMRACAAPRPGQDGTWIGEQVVAGYCELARTGLAHSIELRDGADLLGGLYGVCLGRMFFGESMFSRRPNASKIALATLVALLRREGVAMIDCQQSTAHLASLGARELRRSQFLQRLAEAVQMDPIDWSVYRGTRLNSLLADH